MFFRVKHIKKGIFKLVMVRDNTYLVKATGVVCVILGVIASLGLAVREQPNYFYLTITGILVIVGVFTIAFGMRNDEKWIAL